MMLFAILFGLSMDYEVFLLSRVREEYPDVWVSVSVTTRTPRPGESDGVDYTFVDDAEFDSIPAVDENGADGERGAPSTPPRRRARRGPRTR